MQTPINIDPRIKISKASVATSNATATVLDTFPVATGATLSFIAIVNGRRTGGSSGAAGDSCGITINACFKNVSGTVSQVGSSTFTMNANPHAWGGITFTISGTNAQMKVSGAANNDINWTSTSYLNSVQ
jgi:hypothetical protein